MKKIAILTLNGYFNYGNRLQNYATQEVVKSLGFEVETVVNNTSYSSKAASKNGSKFKRLKSMPVKKVFIKITKKSLNLLKEKKIKKLNALRVQRFKDFTSSYIKETDYSITESNIPTNFGNSYDYFLTGSDQVWNPIFRMGSPIDFLTFAPSHKRIAFSPSFGISHIPKEYTLDYKKWLMEMSALSVREEAGATIIKELTGREAVVLVDPTLLLTKEKWLTISKNAEEKPKERYLLTYFLGNISKEKIKEIKMIADRNNLLIINLANLKEEKTYLADPSEFIDYINSASVFLTDSFHGAVFSILLETPFIVYNREGKLPSMNSRIETLLSTFKLESRLYENIKNDSQIFNIDFTHVESILEYERNKSMGYLKKSLQLELFV